jgi:hypothetical protein
VVLAALAGGCGDAVYTGEAETATIGLAAVPRANGSEAVCLDATLISEVVGQPVAVQPAGTYTAAGHLICGYESVDRRMGLVIWLRQGPAIDVAGTFREFAAAARSAATELVPQPDLGERALAYGSPLQSGALAQRGDRLYQAQLNTSALLDPTPQRVLVVDLLRRIVPASQGSR